MQNIDFQGILGWIWGVSPVLIGGAAGYLYYRFVGCKTGLCPITRNPWVSTLYGALLGALWIGQ
jgi:hypothetical protein